MTVQVTMAAASSHLHSRRRGSHHHADVDYDLAEEDSGLDSDHPIAPRKSGRRKRPGLCTFLPLSDDLRWALSAVSSFLLFGLLLGYFMLHHQHRKVILHVMKDPWSHGGAILRGRAGFRHHFYSGAPRFVTIVMPSVVNPVGRAGRLKAIQETWGPSARAIYVVHNSSEFPEAVMEHAVISEEREPYDKFAFPQLLLLPSDMTVDDGLPRLYYVIKTIHEKVNPEFAFFVNDHTFVIPEHLCKFLEFREPTEDMYAGHALRDKDLQIFNSGAAGYVLSRATMEKMMAKYRTGSDPDCHANFVNNKWLQGNPGMATLRCINSLGVRAVDTRAAAHWHRFHAFPLTRVVSGAVDEWYKDKHRGMGQVQDFDPTYEELLAGEDCCARTSVSFHYVEAMEALALFSVRNLLLSNPGLTDHELKVLMYAEWPRDSKFLGFYSRKLPQPDDGEGWSRLLAVLRKISTRETQRDC